MFSIQYWNPSEAQWKGCGEPLCGTREQALAAKSRLGKMCDYTVRFRVWQLPVRA